MASPLSTTKSNIDIANAALSRIGVNKISSFLDETIIGRTLNENFENELEYILGSYPWRFAQDVEVMSKLADAPVEPWTAFYQIPNRFILVDHVLIDGCSERFDVFGRRIAVDPGASSPVVKVVGTTLVTADAWPGYFRKPFIAHLASVICVPITHDEQMAAMLFKEAQGGLLRAQSRDSQGRTARRLDTKAFIRARRGGRRYG